MSINNLKVACSLGSPLAGEPPQLDSILEWELAQRLGLAHKITRDSILEETKIPVPLCKYYMSENRFVWCVSSPIYAANLEYQEHYTKRFPSEKAFMLSENNQKSILTSSGSFKMRMTPIQVKKIDSVVWFAKGDRREILKLLKKVLYLGKNRNMGYGKIIDWNVELIDNDYSVFAGENKILMRTIPKEDAEKQEATGYKLSYGGYKPPYWHPDNYTEVAIPC